MASKNAQKIAPVAITPAMVLKAIVIYLFLFLLPGVPLIFAAPSLTALSENEIPLVIIVLFVVLTVYIIILLDVIAKRIFSFRGIGQPVPLADLRERILHINNETNCPVTVTEKRGRLVVTWKYLDATWWELIRKEGVQESFSIVVRFDEARHRATLTDVAKSISWGVSPGDARFGFSLFRGIDLRFSMGKAWGMRENFTLGKIYDYHFNSSEIRRPLVAAILSAGWDVRFGLF